MLQKLSADMQLEAVEYFHNLMRLQSKRNCEDWAVDVSLHQDIKAEKWPGGTESPQAVHFHLMYCNGLSLSIPRKTKISHGSVFELLIIAIQHSSRLLYKCSVQFSLFCYPIYDSDSNHLSLAVSQSLDSSK